MSNEHDVRREIPDATVNRLPVYLRVLDARMALGDARISSESLAEQAGVTPAKLRKDLSALGSYGVRGVGYDVRTLAEHIAEALGLEREWAVAIVGMGNLGRALATYGGFARKGFAITWLIDDDPRVVGTDVAGRVVVPFDALRTDGHDGVIGVIATPPSAAQQVAERLVAAGVHSILNFAPTVLNLPPDVQVRGVDMATELQILAFRERSSRRAHDDEMKELMA